MPDGGIPPEWVESARAAVKDNTRHPDAGQRFWELKGLLLCPCGRCMTTHMPRRKYKSKTYLNYYYICSHERRYKSGVCEHARYHKAEQVEERIRRLILDLIRRPEVMMEHVREDVEREKKHLKNARRERAAWAEELSKIERRRDAYMEMRADGDITKEEFREKVAELDARRTTAERELGALGASSERVRLLDSLPALVEEYIRELPSLVHGREGTIRDYTYTEEHEEHKRRAQEEGRLPIFPVSPNVFRERTQEEIEELHRAAERERSQRYRAVYELLGLKVVAHKDGMLDVSGSFGIREMKLGTEPSAIWTAVTGEGAEEVPPLDSSSWQEEDRCSNLRLPRLTLSLR